VINLYIDERHDGAVTILGLKGRLRVGGNTLALHKSVRSLILEKKTLILLNLTDVTHVDSCGLGELVASQISARNKGGEIKLLGLTQTLHDLLKLNGLTAVFQAYENEAEAVHSFAESFSNGQRSPRGLG
jgi:anti-sigma B factor antagonist